MRRWLWIPVTLVLAASSGVLAAIATGIGNASDPPAQTVTIDVATGPQGPPGPKGDPGEPGASSCPTGSTFKAVLVNAKNGQVVMYSCVKD